jgi:hypothetical protein
MSRLQSPLIHFGRGWPGAVLLCAALGLCTFGECAGIATAQESNSASAVIQTDFCIFYESLERVARDRKLSLQRSGGSWGCSGGENADRLKERLAIVSDKDKLPFVENGNACDSHKLGYTLVFGSAR